MNYIQKIRQKLGHDPFIHPACRIIVENEAGEILMIRRTDNGQIGIPAGGLEERETIEMAIRREVKEETGLDLGEVEVVGISSHPELESVSYPNGDRIQYFTVEFYSSAWSGTPKPDGEESQEVFWASPDLISHLSPNEQSAFASLEYYRQTAKIRVN
ncbi:MAG: NUDIX domain-containing protein [Bacteroidota bacterium]